MTIGLPSDVLLARIGLDELPPLTIAGLFETTRAFRKAIPFENLDVMAARPVSTKIADIFAKIVLQGRGGWCYELNQLLAELLRRAGFEVNLFLARVCYLRPSPGPLTHLVLQVEIDSQPWLLDVGFGGPGPTEPLSLTGETINSDGARFYVKREMDGKLQLHRWMATEWTPLYEVLPIVVLPIDLEMASHFLSTWPNSPFRKQFLCMSYDGESHWSLEGHEVVKRDAQWQIIERAPIGDAEHLHTLLSQRFRIQVSMDLAQHAWNLVTQGS